MRCSQGWTALVTLLAAGFTTASPAFADGQATATPGPAQPTETRDPSPDQGSAAAPFTLGGYVEGFYQWNFRTPSNRITNFRGFDNRHNSFTLSNVALDAQWDAHNVVGRLTLQVGHTPSTYYAAEPNAPGAAGANATDASLWRYVQQAYAGYRFPVGRGLTVTGGVFLSPIGPESMAVRDNWNWSRANLFFGLPFYHTGLRASYPVTDTWTLTLAAYNGWNSVVDSNDAKSVSAQATRTGEDWSLTVLYFGGIEREDGAAEGAGWRHMLDAYARWRVAPWLALLVHANGGVEPTDFGTAAWVAGALYARLRLQPWLHLAARGDAFHEHTPSNGTGKAAPIFWPVAWVASGTLTLDARPHERISFRLEYRHDQAAGDMYFGGDVQGDGTTTPFAPNRRAQDTVTAGVTAWF